MKFKFVFMLFFSLIVFMPVSCTSSEGVNSTSGGIKWHSYQEGIELGKNKKKKVFINFYADWCGYCKIMEKNTFRDNSVISYLNENFVSIRINTDKDRKTAAIYNVSTLPVTWFLEEDGKQLTSLPGYVPSEKLLSILKFIHTESYKEMKYTEFIKKK